MHPSASFATNPYCAGTAISVVDSAALQNEPISFVYYPSMREVSCLGHAELRFGRKSWNLLKGMGDRRVRSFEQMLQASEGERGIPFIQFFISASPEQVKALSQNLGTRSANICSRGVCAELERSIEYSVPMPFTISPLSSAVYLTLAKGLGSKRITRIEFCGNSNRIYNLKKCATGMAGEACLVFIFCFGAFMMIAPMILNFYQD